MVTEDYICPHPEVEYWEKHINGILLKEWEPYIKGVVLDIGCNHGAETVIISRMANVDWVSGIDINSEAIELANKRPDFLQVGYFVHDICKPFKFPWDIIKWDTIIAFHVLEHVENVYEAVENMRRQIKPRGRVLISVLYEDAYPSEYHKRMFNLEKLQNIFQIWAIEELYRDQRIDGHGNQHDVINLRARKY